MSNVSDNKQPPPTESMSIDEHGNVKIKKDGEYDFPDSPNFQASVESLENYNKTQSNTLEIPPRLKYLQKYYEKFQQPYNFTQVEFDEIDVFHFVKENPLSVLHIIDKVFRIYHKLRRKEYLVYDMTTMVTDPITKKPREISCRYGHYVLPVFGSANAVQPGQGAQAMFNQNTVPFQPGMALSPQGDLNDKRYQVRKEGLIAAYTIDWNADAVAGLISKSSYQVTNFYVGYAANDVGQLIEGAPYTIRNKEDFLKGSFTELIEMGQYAYSTTTPALDNWRKEGATVKSQTLEETRTNMRTRRPIQNT